MADHIINLQGVDLTAKLAGSLTVNSVTTTRLGDGNKVWSITDGSYVFDFSGVTLRELVLFGAPGMVVTGQREHKKLASGQGTFTVKVRDLLDRERVTPAIVGNEKIVTAALAMLENGMDPSKIATTLGIMFKPEQVAAALKKAVELLAETEETE